MRTLIKTDELLKELRSRFQGESMNPRFQSSVDALNMAASELQFGQLMIPLTTMVEYSERMLEILNGLASLGLLHYVGAEPGLSIPLPSANTEPWKSGFEVLRNQTGEAKDSIRALKRVFKAIEAFPDPIKSELTACEVDGLKVIGSRVRKLGELIDKVLAELDRFDLTHQLRELE